MVTDSEAVTRGADLADDTIQLPKDLDSECVAQTLYESGISDEVMNLLRDLGSKPEEVGSFVIGSADERKITVTSR